MSRRVSARWIVPLWIPIIIGGCTPVRVATEALPGPEEPRFGSFAVAPLPEAGTRKQVLSTEFETHIRSEIARTLEERGYRPGEPDQVDVSVDFELTSEKSTGLVNAGDPDIDYYVPDTSSTQRMVIVVSDAGSGEPLWRGVGEARLQTRGPWVASDALASARASVRKILAQLPPPRH